MPYCGIWNPNNANACCVDDSHCFAFICLSIFWNMLCQNALLLLSKLVRSVSNFNTKYLGIRKFLQSES